MSKRKGTRPHAREQRPACLRGHAIFAWLVTALAIVVALLLSRFIRVRGERTSSAPPAAGLELDIVPAEPERMDALPRLTFRVPESLPELDEPPLEAPPCYAIRVRYHTGPGWDERPTYPDTSMLRGRLKKKGVLSDAAVRKLEAADDKKE